MNAPSQPSKIKAYSRGLLLPAICLLLGIGYYCINSLGVPLQTAKAQVVAKSVIQTPKTYRTTMIGKQVHVQSQPSYENCAFIVKLDDQEVTVFVGRELYQSTTKGAWMDVTYRQTRLSGAKRIVSIRPTTVTPP